MDAYKGSVLIVEDDISLRMSLSIVLTAAGYRVRVAEDGLNALAQMRSDVPDILISDLHMPRMSGFELLSVVRRRFPSIQVLAMSGGMFDMQIPAGIAADDFHRKGTNLGSLLEKLQGMVESVATHRVRTLTQTPVWVSQPVHDGMGQRPVMLTCPECLRVFAQPLDAVERLIHQARCTHCATAVAFAIVQHAEISAGLRRSFGEEFESQRGLMRDGWSGVVPF